MKTIFTMIALTLVVTISKAQMIPNGGFETWTSMGGGTYNNPNGWDCLNNSTMALSVFTCEQGTANPSSGAHYLKLTSKTMASSVAPGIAVSGVIDSVTQTAKSGFAYTNRSANLTGSWQHMVYGTSQGYIDVKLTRWDSGNNIRVTVASAHQQLSGMAMSWASFSIPLTYGTDINNPDTCIITLAASGANPANNDYLWVDGLAFAGTVGISENTLDATISLFPNPATDNLMIDLSAVKEQKVSIHILDMQGKVVKSVESVVATTNNTIDIANLATGNYMLNVITKEGIITRKFIKK